ncbi:MAG: MATE family efflux transporter [Pyrinomonadaceae bacterium]|jgi:putative MATE family efflux protein|nr:MATE family efflux transporter [Pyrinomonadaceae bacterium]
MSEINVSASAKTLDNSFWSILKEAFFGSNRDFTQGSIKIAIFILSVPMIIEMFAESLFAIVDMFYVGKLGANAVAIVGMTEIMMYLVYSIAIGISISATASVSRRIGEKDEEGAAKAATHAIYLGLIASFLMGIIGIIFAADFLRLLGANADLVNEGTNFVRISLGSSFVVIFLFLLNAIFRGAGDAAIAMRVLWIANLSNIILNPIFIFWLDLGVTGAAIGTVLGRGIGVLLASYALFFGKRRFAICREHWKIDFSRLWRLTKIASPAALQFTIQSSSFMVLMPILASFGSNAAAGYTIGWRIVIFAILPSMGLANAAATLIGQNLGANNPDRAEKSVWTAVFYNVIVQTSIGILLVIFAEPLVKLFTNDPNVLPIAINCLKIVSYGFFFYAIGMVLEGSFNGAGDTWTPTFINLFVFWIFEIPLAYLLAYKFGLGEQGVFWAIFAAFSMLTIISSIFFKRGKWKLKEV